MGIKSFCDMSLYYNRPIKNKSHYNISPDFYTYEEFHIHKSLNSFSDYSSNYSDIILKMHNCWISRHFNFRIKYNKFGELRCIITGSNKTHKFNLYQMSNRNGLQNLKSINYIADDGEE